MDVQLEIKRNTQLSPNIVWQTNVSRTVQKLNIVIGKL